MKNETEKQRFIKQLHTNFYGEYMDYELNVVGLLYVYRVTHNEYHEDLKEILNKDASYEIYGSLKSFFNNLLNNPKLDPKFCKLIEDIKRYKKIDFLSCDKI